MPYVRDVKSQIMIVRAVCDIIEQRGESAEPSEKNASFGATSWGEKKQTFSCSSCLMFGLRRAESCFVQSLALHDRFDVNG